MKYILKMLLVIMSFSVFAKDVDINKKNKNDEEMLSNKMYYFVHSYALDSKETNEIMAYTTYNQKIPAISTIGIAIFEFFNSSISDFYNYFIYETRKYSKFK